MFTKKSHQDVKKSTVKIQDSKKDSATRLKHLKIVLEHFDGDESKTYFEGNFSHVYFILYDNFIQAENNLRQRELPFHLVHKAGKEELEGALSLLEKVLCLLPELIGKRWQLHSLTRIFSKLLHNGNSQKLRAEAIRYFLLWYQALGDNAPNEVHKMFATLVPGMPEPTILPSGTPLKPKSFDITSNAAHESGDFSIEDIMQHPNFNTADNVKKVVVEQAPVGIMGKLAHVSASIFHDTNALNPVQSVEIQPLLPPSANEKPIDNETKYFFDILLECMASSITKIQWRDRSHAKSMRCFAFLLEKFKIYYLPIICPQFNNKNSLYKPNLELPVQHNILEDDYVLCRVTLIKWVASYAHFMKKQGSDGGQPSSMTSTGSQLPPSGTPTPATSLHHEEETSFTVGHPSDSSRASSHDSASNTPHPSLESGSGIFEELNSELVVRDVLCCSCREHVDFTVEVLRQAFLLPFAHAAATRRVIALYKDWIQMNVGEIPPFLMENTVEQQTAGGEPAPPRRLRNDSYLGALGRDNVMVRAGMQNILQVFMTQAATVFLASASPVAPPGGLGQQQLLEEQTDTCKRVLNIYRYMVMHVAMDANTWEQLLLVLLQITSLVLTKVPPKRKQESLGGFLAPALFQTLIVTWIKANLNVAVKPELWQNFMELLTRLTHWEDLIKEWAKTMETLTRVLARHVYSLDLSETAAGGDRGRGRRGPAAQPLPRPALPPHAAAADLAHHAARTPGQYTRLLSAPLPRPALPPHAAAADLAHHAARTPGQYTRLLSAPLPRPALPPHAAAADLAHHAARTPGQYTRLLSAPLPRPALPPHAAAADLAHHAARTPGQYTRLLSAPLPRPALPPHAAAADLAHHAARTPGQYTRLLSAPLPRPALPPHAAAADLAHHAARTPGQYTRLLSAPLPRPALPPHAAAADLAHHAARTPGQYTRLLSAPLPRPALPPHAAAADLAHHAARTPGQYTRLLSAPLPRPALPPHAAAADLAHHAARTPGQYTRLLSAPLPRPALPPHAAAADLAHHAARTPGQYTRLLSAPLPRPALPPHAAAADLAHHAARTPGQYTRLLSAPLPRPALPPHAAAADLAHHAARTPGQYTRLLSAPLPRPALPPHAAAADLAHHAARTPGQYTRLLSAPLPRPALPPHAAAADLAHHAARTPGQYTRLLSAPLPRPALPPHAAAADLAHHAARTPGQYTRLLSAPLPRPALPPHAAAADLAHHAARTPGQYTRLLSAPLPRPALPPHAAAADLAHHAARTPGQYTRLLSAPLPRPALPPHAAAADLAHHAARTPGQYTRLLSAPLPRPALPPHAAAADLAHHAARTPGQYTRLLSAPLPRPALPPHAAAADLAHHAARTPGKSPKSGHEPHPRKEANTRRQLTRCRSDPHLTKHAQAQTDTKEPISDKPRRWYSLDSLRNSSHQEERDSASGSRSPSPAPSSGVESSSIKDSPLQIDLASDGGNVEWSESESCEGGSLGGCGTGVGVGVGVVMGGRARGWLPDVAAALWRRMLAALGDPNLLRDPHAHANLYNYLIHLNSTLLKISANQTLNGNTEIHVPFNLVAGWCLEAEALPPSHRAGKLLALRLLCESTQAQGPGAPSSCNNRLHLAHLHLYQRALHHGLTGEDRSVVDVLVEHAAPRYLSLALDGYSLLLLDFVHASTVVLNSSDMGPSCPRTAAVTFLGSLLSLPDGLMNAPMLQPYPHQYNTVSCPDLKEHVLNIVVRVCRREGAGAARCAGACALTAHVAHALAARAACPRLPAYVTCLLQMLMMKNKNIAKVVSDCILVLADYTDRIVELYPGLAGKIIKWICACLAQISPTSGRDSVKPLAGSLLLCLAEFAVRCGPAYLMQEKDGEQTLLLMIFKVLYAVMKGSNGADIEGLSLPVDEDFDPNIQLDNLGPKTSPASTIDVKLWAQTICTQLVLFLGHWPLWGGWQLSSSVCEQHDSPALGGELGPAVLAAPHVQLLRLSDSTLASLVELPALDLPAATTPGLVTSDRQVRILLRDIAGKACWDASALYYDPSVASSESLEPLELPESIECPRDNTLSSLPPPLPPDLLPDYKNSPPDKHQLDHVLSYIGHTSPEVVCTRRLDAAGPSPLPPGAEDELVAALVAHRNQERHYLAARDWCDEEEAPLVYEAAAAAAAAASARPFAVCRALAAQLGVLAPPRRAHAHLLRRSDRLLRELRNLDAQRCRETHKVAVIYVAKGQETRNEILSNRCGSPAYEAFLAALAWEVELESHVGFTGGLRGGGGGGVSAPYAATLTLEALFHVATRMPADTPDAILNKTRHLGNDEVHVVWSEHWRPYKRDTLPTQFCDVLVALYPLPGGLLRVTVSRKPDVCVFGPLWEECIIRARCGAALVRGAAVCGGRAVRATMPLYQHAYGERARSLDALVAHHTLPTTFEQFVERVRDPLPDRADHPDHPDRHAANERGSGRLAAALLDHGASAWGGAPPLAVSPRAAKRLGPFKRPTHAPPAPHTAPPHTAPPVLPAPRRNR